MFLLIRISAFEAFRTLRANLVHTLLSTLGIIIGVAALVAILSLGDGMEKFGREQLSATTNVASIFVNPKTGEEVDGIWMKKEHFSAIGEHQAARLAEQLQGRGGVFLSASSRSFFNMAGDTLRKPALIQAFWGTPPGKAPELLHGRFPDAGDLSRRDTVAVLSQDLAARLCRDSNLAVLLEQKLMYQNTALRIIGILKKSGDEERPTVYFPLYALDTAELRKTPPNLIVTANKVEEVQPMKAEIEQWLQAQVPGGPEEFDIMTSEFRVEQMRRVVLVFKIIMGMITGIAVLVGGIGVMNVLLMSISERTREIGIRKALGAKKRTIAMQFLAESLVISLLGCFLGLLLGMLFMAVAVPVVKHFAEVPFYATLSGSSVLVVLLVAVLVGVAFGTFPAMKAARLTPVDAIRRE